MKKIVLFSLVAVLFAACSSEETVENTDPNVVIEQLEDGQLITYESGLTVKLKDGKYFVSDDVLLSEEQIQEINKEGKLRAGTTNTRYRWQNRTVPYKFREGDFDETQKNFIRSVWENFNTRTCVVVREATPADQDYLLVTNESSGAWSYLGRIGGEQQINFQHDNWETTLISGTLLRTMLTAMGTVAEFHRPDRDDYIAIIWNNIKSGTENNFNKYPWVDISTFGVPFDYESVTFPIGAKYYCSKNGQPTMISLRNPNEDLGNNIDFTENDIESLNRMYGCQ